MKVYLVTGYTWYDEFGESSLHFVAGVFYSKEKASIFISEQEKKDGKNTKKRGTSYEVEEREVV